MQYNVSKNNYDVAGTINSKSQQVKQKGNMKNLELIRWLGWEGRAEDVIPR